MKKNMTFSEALEMMKKGYSVRMSGWISGGYIRIDENKNRIVTQDGLWYDLSDFAVLSNCWETAPIELDATADAVWGALLDGKKIAKSTWGVAAYVKLSHDRTEIVSDTGTLYSIGSFNNWVVVG